MQLVAALLQAKERADPQGWLTFQVGVTSASRDVPLPTGLLALHARASQMHLAAVFESNAVYHAQPRMLLLWPLQLACRRRSALSSCSAREWSERQTTCRCAGCGQSRCCFREVSCLPATWLYMARSVVCDADTCGVRHA